MQWLPIYEDAEHNVLLYNTLTGAVRAAPWIALRTSAGRVYFANLVTRQTRWFPPHRWMEDWIARPPVCCDEWYDYRFEPSSTIGRMLLPLAIGRVRVEGGAPYLDAAGVPPYYPDELDTARSYPGLVFGPRISYYDAHRAALDERERVRSFTIMQALAPRNGMIR